MASATPLEQVYAKNSSHIPCKSLVFLFKENTGVAGSFLPEPVFKCKALKETAVTGKILSQAAEIIVTAGAQMDAMLEKMDALMLQMLEDRGDVVSEYSDHKYDRNEWICTDYLLGYALKAKGRGKRKDYGQVGIHLAFHNEQYCGNGGWEPCLFVFYAPGNENFSLESLDYIVSENFICPQDNRIWRWAELEERNSEKDSWMFAVRLVSINTEGDIQAKIVQPTQAILSDPSDSRIALTCEETFFRFEWEGDTFRMSL